VIEVVLFVLGVIVASLTGFFSPYWYLGFLPLAAGLITAVVIFDFEREVESGAPPSRSFPFA
jgi:hypothetical protein